MSRAYKCDRCGRLFEEYPSVMIGDLDLCEKCGHSLYDWINTCKHYDSATNSCLAEKNISECPCDGNRKKCTKELGE